MNITFVFRLEGFQVLVNLPGTYRPSIGEQVIVTDENGKTHQGRVVEVVNTFGHWDEPSITMYVA